MACTGCMQRRAMMRRAVTATRSGNLSAVRNELRQLRTSAGGDMQAFLDRLRRGNPREPVNQRQK